MKYTKRFFTAFLFVLGLVGLLILSSHLFLPKSNKEGLGMEDARANGIVGEKDNTVDILILGDSESYASFIPLELWRDTGYTSYICGTSRQTLDYTKIMLRKAFNKQSPKIVLLETNAIFRKQSKSNILFTRLGEKFSVFRYHNRWKALGWSDIKKSADFTWSDDYKGFRHSTVIKPVKKTDYIKSTQEAEHIPKLNRFCVQTIKEFCDANGARLIFYSAPSTVNWNMARHNSIQALVSELNCDYIDMNLLTKEIQIDWSKDTRDKGDHLNYFGAKKVTSYMSDYLSKTGLLTGHRGDPDYAKWDEALNRFETVVS